MRLITGKTPEELPRNFMDSLTQSLMSEAPLDDIFSSKAEVTSNKNAGVIKIRMDELPAIVARDGEPVGYQYRDARLHIDTRRGFVPSVSLIVDSAYSPESLEIPDEEKERLYKILEPGPANIVYGMSPRRIMQIVTERGAISFYNGMKEVLVETTDQEIEPDTASQHINPVIEPILEDVEDSGTATETAIEKKPIETEHVDTKDVEDYVDTARDPQIETSERSLRDIRVPVEYFERITGRTHQQAYSFARKKGVKKDELNAQDVLDYIDGSMRGKASTGKTADEQKQEARERLKSFVSDFGISLDHVAEGDNVLVDGSEIYDPTDLRRIIVDPKNFIEITGKNRSTPYRLARSLYKKPGELNAYDVKQYIESMFGNRSKDTDVDVQRQGAMEKLEAFVSGILDTNKTSSEPVVKRPETDLQLPQLDAIDLESIKIDLDDFNRIAYTLEQYEVAKSYRSQLGIAKTRGTNARKMGEYIEKFSENGVADSNSVKAAKKRMDIFLHMNGVEVTEIEEREYYTTSEVTFIGNYPHGSSTKLIKKIGAKRIGHGWSKEDVHRYLESAGRLPEKLREKLSENPTLPNTQEIVEQMEITEIAERLGQNAESIRTILNGYGIEQDNGTVLLSDLIDATSRGTQIDPILRAFGYKREEIAELHQTPIETSDYLGIDLSGTISKRRFGEIIGRGRKGLVNSLVSRYKLSSGSGQLNVYAVASLAVDTDETGINPSIRNVLLKELGLSRDPEKAKKQVQEYKSEQETLEIDHNGNGEFDISKTYSKDELDELGLKKSHADYVRQRTGGMPNIPGYRVVATFLEDRDFNTLGRLGIKGTINEVASLVETHKRLYSEAQRRD